jgi:hypothetical protein
VAVQNVEWLTAYGEVSASKKAWCQRLSRAVAIRAQLIRQALR